MESQQPAPQAKKGFKTVFITTTTPMTRRDLLVKGLLKAYRERGLTAQQANALAFREGIFRYDREALDEVIEPGNYKVQIDEVIQKAVAEALKQPVSSNLPDDAWFRDGAGGPDAEFSPVLDKIAWFLNKIDTASYVMLGTGMIARVGLKGMLAKKLEKEVTERLVGTVGDKALGLLRKNPMTRRWLTSAHKYLPDSTKISSGLLDEARRARAEIGISKEAFQSYNVAAAKVRVGKDEVRYISAINKAGEHQHAEGELLEKLRKLREEYEDRTITIEELFTERSPCTAGGCASLLTQKFGGQTLSEVPVFYLVHMGTKNRGIELANKWGIFFK